MNNFCLKTASNICLPKFSSAQNQGKIVDYQKLSLLSLIQRIVDHHDRNALEELHNHRTIFICNGSEPMPFINFINRLRESTANKDWPGFNAFELADMAYNLTVDKFSNIPNKNVKPQGPHCRYYLKAYQKLMTKSFEKKQPEGQIEEECRAASVLQGLIRRQFYFSLLEAKRKLNPFWSRYNYGDKATKICVWLPVILKGHKRRAWLDKNVANIDPTHPSARQRMQEIIDQEFVKEKFIEFNENSIAQHIETSRIWHASDENFDLSLAKIVADEKAANIEKQRRSIRVLGKEKLKQLILIIFENIKYDENSDNKIAKDFGLSKATFSRFAGSKWSKKDSPPPDLWLNSAHVVSNHDAFREAAQEAGLWQQVQETLKKETFNSSEG